MEQVPGGLTLKQLSDGESLTVPPRSTQRLFIIMMAGLAIAVVVIGASDPSALIGLLIPFGVLWGHGPSLVETTLTARGDDLTIRFATHFGMRTVQTSLADVTRSYQPYRKSGFVYTEEPELPTDVRLRALILRILEYPSPILVAFERPDEEIRWVDSWLESRRVAAGC